MVATGVGAVTAGAGVHDGPVRTSVDVTHLMDITIEFQPIQNIATPVTNRLIAVAEAASSKDPRLHFSPVRDWRARLHLTQRDVQHRLRRPVDVAHRLSHLHHRLTRGETMPATTARDVRALFDRYAAAWADRDPDAIAALHTEDTQFWLRSGGEAVHGREPARATFATTGSSTGHSPPCSPTQARSRRSTS